jgi:hypothetical protein
MTKVSRSGDADVADAGEELGATEQPPLWSAVVRHPVQPCWAGFGAVASPARE